MGGWVMSRLSRHSASGASATSAPACALPLEQAKYYASGTEAPAGDDVDALARRVRPEP